MMGYYMVKRLSHAGFIDVLIVFEMPAVINIHDREEFAYSNSALEGRLIVRLSRMLRLQSILDEGYIP